MRCPYVTVGAEHVLRLGSADGSLAAHRPTSPPLPTERLSAGCHSEVGPKAAQPVLV